MCDVTYQKLYGSEITDFTKVRKYIDYLLDNVIVFFSRWLYDILRLVAL